LSEKELNLASKKLGLIVLRDTTAIDKGNIYVWANVQFISAAIFADGGIISSEFKIGEDRIENYADSPTRTSKLKKQLVIEGSIITQNTLGGSLSGSGHKSVPASVDSVYNESDSIRQLNMTVAYDLNTLRRFADTKYTTRNRWDTHPLVLIYNPKNLSDPPAGFFPRK
jgi:hypothetical protein